MKSALKYRLGIDLGANSLGWCLVALDRNDNPFRFIRLGVRIFPDGRNPKDGSSLAAARRAARSMRRRRDRFLKRRARLMRLMIEHGFMPKDRVERAALRSLDPYVLRQRALDHALAPFEFGRALFHLNQRRGFKSNRIVDKSGDDDSGKIKGAISQVKAKMAHEGARTIGEWLFRRHELRQPVRARLNGQGAKSSYDLYVERSMIQDEFDAIWAKQAEFDPNVFTPIARDILRDALLFQRRLRPVVPGKCPFEPKESRAALALPSVQQFRIYQEVNNLRIRSTGVAERALTKEERDRVANELMRSRDRTFDQLRKLLGLSEDAVFNLESEKRLKLRGDLTGVALAHKSRFGSGWWTMPLADQDEVATLLLETESEDSVIRAFHDRFNLSEEKASSAATAPLVEGYGSLSKKAISRILPHLKREVVTYDVAAGAAGYEHTRRHNGGEMTKLPYYAEYLPHYVGTGTGERSDPLEKRYGRIANPTVHIGLNQLRAVVNAIISKYGRPHQIVIELARDLKLSSKKKKELEQKQKIRQDENDRYRDQLEKLGLPPKGGNLLLFRLWEQLAPSPNDRRCPYTGEMISISKLFSSEVEVEHILPFSQTLDDSESNKTVAIRRGNRDKGNRSPFEAFGHSPGEYSWDSILNRVSLMPYPKRRRFAPDALEQFKVEGDFLARHLNDTAYLSRVAREYLTAVCPSNNVWVIPGRMTAMLRSRWGLNTLLADGDIKNRTDHRHHSIDAAVVAVSDRSLLSRISKLAARNEETAVRRFLEGLEEPWSGFRTGLAFGLSKIYVSYKPDHDVSTRLHNDTAYGVVDRSASFDRAVEVVHREQLSTLKSDKDVAAIRDAHLRNRIAEIVKGKSGKDLSAALEAFGAQTGIRRVRVTLSLSVIPIRRSDGEVYKAYKGDSNYCYQVYERATDGKWIERVVSSFEAASGEVREEGSTLIMQLCVNDTVEASLGESGTSILRVVKLSSGSVVLAEHFEGGRLKERDADRSDRFKYLSCSATRLRKLKAKQVVVDPLGQVWPMVRTGERADS